MKFIVLSILLLGSSVVFACPEGLCVGSRAIDPYNNAGDIREIFNNGAVKFHIDGYGVVDRKSDQLSPHVNCLIGFCTDVRAIDQYNNVGNIKEIFNNGGVKFHIDGYGVVDRQVTGLARSFRCVESLCVGDRAIDKFNNSGNIREIFENGAVKFHIDGYGVVDRNIQDLGVGENCTITRTCHCKN